MPTFSSKGAQIFYEEEGQGAPIVLVHGFASNLRRNWKDVGWFKWLTDAGHRVIALDCRGHGRSEKFYDTADYADMKMPGDVLNLMDHLGVERASLMGYSMGAMISARLVQYHEDRIEKVILAGMGGVMVSGKVRDNTAIVKALLAENVDDIESLAAKGYRTFADGNGEDARALATYMQNGHPTFGKDAFNALTLPVLVVAGEKDDIIGVPEELTDCFQNGQTIIVPKRNHQNTVGDKVYRQAVIDFLGA